MIVLEKLVQEPFQKSAEWRHVNEVADHLFKELSTPDVLNRIKDANKPGTPSARIQEVFRPSAEKLGFQSERKGLFSTSIPNLRPDYYLPLGDTGIILEVERGKTTTNNMDLLDFWKCHLCKTAAYLFLVVPQELQHNHGMTPKKEYNRVLRRLAPFFSESNYTNVRGLCLFGY